MTQTQNQDEPDEHLAQRPARPFDWPSWNSSVIACFGVSHFDRLNGKGRRESLTCIRAWPRQWRNTWKVNGRRFRCGSWRNFCSHGNCLEQPTSRWPQFSSGSVSVMAIGTHSPSPFTPVSSSHYILSPGYVLWDTPYTARKVTSPVNAMANRSQIIVLTAGLYLLVIITTYHKVSHFEQTGTCYSSLSIDNDFCLLDPKGMDDRTSYSSNVTSCQVNFKQDVVNRDRCCMMTGTTLYDACHIIPHSKGDQVRSSPLYRSRRSF